MRWVFLAALSHKLNVIFHVSTHSPWEFSNPTDTSAKNVTLCGGFTLLAELNYLCIYILYYFGLDPLSEQYVWWSIGQSGCLEKLSIYLAPE